MQAHKPAWKRTAAKRRKKPIPEGQKKLGARIRQLREERGWSQEGFAHEAGLGRSFTGDIERGQKDIRFSTLSKIAKCLGLSLSELFRGFENDAV